MNYNLPMPSLGADMDEGKIVEWKIKTGDSVKKNQIIASVETTKSVIDIESFREGVVMNLLKSVGDVVHVGETIAIFDILGEEILDQKEQRIKVSPAAKKMCEDNHIDFKQMIGTGKEGEITLQDVENKLQSTKVEKIFSGKNLRQAIASLMSRSKKEVPHYYLKKRIHLDLLMKWQDETNRNVDPSRRLLTPVLLMKAVINSLKKYPEMNGIYKDENFAFSTNIHLGFAIAFKEGGVLVPAILDADAMSILELNAAVLDLITRARDGHLKSRELSEGTFTITNIGDLGSDEVFGIIFPPQVALIGIGHIRKEPIIDSQDLVRAGFVVDITLSADHRVSDGILGAKFLNEIDKNLNSPSSLG
ncbi:MAG: dihydrolipoamide acetyltransferase family protein [Bacteriovorax sp.]|nr:dihydrolipoamide acetyltransferase family protein [Bacteriovorax sp.]